MTDPTPTTTVRTETQDLLDAIDRLRALVVEGKTSLVIVAITPDRYLRVNHICREQGMSLLGLLQVEQHDLTCQLTRMLSVATEDETDETDETKDG